MRELDFAVQTHDRVSRLDRQPGRRPRLLDLDRQFAVMGDHL